MMWHQLKTLSQRARCPWYITATLLLFASICFAQQTQPVTLPLEEFSTTSEINGITVVVKSTGTALISMVDNGVQVKIDAIADLSDFQNKSGDIVRAALNEDEECSHTISFPDVMLVPQSCVAAANCSSAEMQLNGRYEKKACLFGHEKKLLKQAFTCNVSLFPEIANNTLQIRSEISDFSAEGVLGKLMTIDTIKKKIVSMIEQNVKDTNQALTTSIDMTLPEEFNDLHPTLESATFQEDSKHSLFLKIGAVITIPEERTENALSLFQKISAKTQE